HESFNEGKARRNIQQRNGKTDDGNKRVINIVGSSLTASSRNQRARFVSELQDFIRFPSVSAQPRHAPDVQRCAAWLAVHLRRSGLRNVQIIPTARHPIVYADWMGAPGRPTVLIYGHYDVQPAEPFEAWRTPPFEPTVIGDNLFGRGACDDKG